MNQVPRGCHDSGEECRSVPGEGQQTEGTIQVESGGLCGISLRDRWRVSKQREQHMKRQAARCMMGHEAGVGRDWALEPWMACQGV